MSNSLKVCHSSVFLHILFRQLIYIVLKQFFFISAQSLYLTTKKLFVEEFPWSFVSFYYYHLNQQINQTIDYTIILNHDYMYHDYPIFFFYDIYDLK